MLLVINVLRLFVFVRVLIPLELKLKKPLLESLKELEYLLKS